MGTFRPVPFASLCRRMLREAERGAAIFDLPARRFVTGAGDRDLAVCVHGHPAATPLGPAAGPHTQLAQNIVLSWLVGGRVIELKTVQARDDLVIPRPCIDARTVGYNVEWSQELALEESLEEYVKASMLIDLLAASGFVGLAPGFDRAVFEASVGYDLAGITGDRVAAFLRGLADARPTVERLRREIPSEWRGLRDLDFRTRVAGGVTLSTFHGCPPGEIERIAAHLLHDHGLGVVLKLNPTLLGARDLRRLLHDALGYRDVVVPDTAFTRDPSWEEALASIERTRRTAASCGLDAGIKLTNTLLVDNPGGLLPAGEKEAYLSGPPLHVLAIELLRRVRRALGPDLPVSFSAGIDAHNFADAVALGLAPVTVCTDWLKAGGYGRAHRYFEELEAAMARAGARSREDFVLLASGKARAALASAGATSEEEATCLRALTAGTSLRRAAGEALYARWVAEAARANTEAYADAVAVDARYGAAANARAPTKTGRHLTLLDCIACDKCIPVCPNDANFSFVLPGEHPHAHQIGNVVDLCNECGNCDAFCPEEGGPYRVKPRFFLSAAAFAARPETDGFFLERERALARVGGRVFAVVISDGRASYTGAEGTPELLGLIEGLQRAVLAPGATNFPSIVGST
jgi:putative selenate reductase